VGRRDQRCVCVEAGVEDVSFCLYYLHKVQVPFLPSLGELRSRTENEAILWFQSIDGARKCSC